MTSINLELLNNKMLQLEFSEQVSFFDKNKK